MHTYSQDSRLLIEVDGVHDNEDLLVFVRQARRFFESRFAVVLDPPMLAQEGGRETYGKTEFEGKAVDAGGEKNRNAS